MRIEQNAPAWSPNRVESDGAQANRVQDAASTPTASTPTASTPTASTPTASTPTASTPTASTPAGAQPTRQRPIPPAEQQLARRQAAWRGDGMRQQVADAAEALERATIGGKNVAGQLSTIVAGDDSRGMTLTIHGANGSPVTMSAFHEAADNGGTVATFAYDDTHRSLKKSVVDLTDQLRTWLKANPSAPLEVDAHSQGARIALVAMDVLAREGLLDGREVELNLITPPLQGVVSGSFSVLMPEPMREAVGTVVPLINTGLDMSPIGNFQQRIEAASLPKHVNTRIFVADKASNDTFVDVTASAFRRVAQNLRAHVIELPGTDHTSAVAGAKRFLTPAPPAAHDDMP